MNDFGDSDSDDELPPGWEERATQDGKVFYANHDLKSTQWVHPRTGKQKRVTGDLPYGWEKKNTEDGLTFFIDHINQKTTYTDPRLAFAIENNESAMDIRQRFDANSTALQILHGRDISGKVVIVTGSTSGIGYETAKSLAYHGAEVIIPCRDVLKGNKAIETMKFERSNLNVTTMELDLNSLKSVQDFANEFKIKYRRLDILILNAGVMQPFALTPDGFEMTFQVNHLSQFYLTNLLEPLLISSAPARVVIVSSESHRFSYLTTEKMCEERLSPRSSSGSYSMMLYNDSKLCNVLFSNELNRRLESKGVHSNSLHPGNMVSTNIQRSSYFMRFLFGVVRPFTKSLQQASSTSVFCAVAPELDGIGGMYFNNCFRCQPSAMSENEEAAQELWQISNKMIKKWEEK